MYLSAPKIKIFYIALVMHNGSNPFLTSKAHRYIVFYTYLSSLATNTTPKERHRGHPRRNISLPQSHPHPLHHTVDAWHVIFATHLRLPCRHTCRIRNRHHLSNHGRTFVAQSAHTLHDLGLGHRYPAHFCHWWPSGWLVSPQIPTRHPPFRPPRHALQAQKKFRQRRKHQRSLLLPHPQLHLCRIYGRHHLPRRRQTFLDHGKARGGKAKR